MVYKGIYWDILVYTDYIHVYTDIYSDQVKLINAAIDRAKPGSSLHGLPHVADPSAEVVDVLITCMEWNIATSQSRIAEDSLGCRTRLLSSLTFCSAICLTRLVKRASGILRRLTAFCTRSGRSSCGVIPITQLVRDLRYVYTKYIHIYSEYIPIYTSYN